MAKSFSRDATSANCCRSSVRPAASSQRRTPSSSTTLANASLNSLSPCTYSRSCPSSWKIVPASRASRHCSIGAKTGSGRCPSVEYVGTPPTLTSSPRIESFSAKSLALRSSKYPRYATQPAIGKHQRRGTTENSGVATTLNTTSGRPRSA
jgi:hypothetical protein